MHPPTLLLLLMVIGDAGMVYRVGTAGTQDLGSGNITFDVAITLYIMVRFGKNLTQLMLLLP
jgi:hypothetical protein